MKKATLPLVFILTVLQYALAQTPVLGIYPNATVSTASGNTTVIPSMAPTNTTSITAATSTGFKGVLHVNPITGIVTVTNAHPAGTYNLTVKAFNGALHTISNFILTVNNTTCSQGLFTSSTPNFVVSKPYGIAIGDFNNDGKQDVATANSGGFNAVSIRLGTGSSVFSGNTNVTVGAGPISVSVADFNGDGKQDFAAANSGSNTISIRLGDGTGMFSGTTEVAVGPYPYQVTVGDFNGDGKKDLAVPNYNGNTLSIRFGDGDGNFTGNTNIPVGNNPSAAGLGDFNGDGQQDIAVVSHGDDNVTTFLGNGTGSFTAGTTVPVGDFANSIAIGDFNADGKQDFATSNANSNTVSVRLGDGAGNFTGTTEITVGTAPSCVIIGDFNGDGKQDFAAANNFNSSHLSVRLGDGAGAFITAPNIPINNNPHSLAVGDFNADGRQDIAATNSSGYFSVSLSGINEINVLGNSNTITDGDNTPSPTDFTNFGTISGGVLVRTFNIQNTGASNLKISAISVTGADASMFVSAGITLPSIIAAGAATTFTVTFSPSSVGIKTATVNIINDDCDEALYDFAIQGSGPTPPVLGQYPATTITTAGGNATINPTAAPNNTTNILATTSPNFKGVLHVNPTTGIVTVTNAHPAGVYLINVKAINGALSSAASCSLTVNNTGCSQGSFAGSTNITVGTNPNSVAMADFNGDGKQDFAAVNEESRTVSVRLGDGLGGFAGTTEVPVAGFANSIAVGDINGDGNQDFVVAGIAISIRLGNGTGGFTVAADLGVTSANRSVAIGDFNNDSKPDLATVTDEDFLLVRLGDGTGNFGVAAGVLVGTQPRTLAISDFDNDGNQDVVAISKINNAASIRFGNGTGGFTGNTEIPLGAESLGVTVADFNNDSRQDFAVAHNNSNTIAIRLNNGVGGFTPAPNVFVGLYPTSTSAADFNGDGNLDIASANGEATVSIRLGNGAGGFSGTNSITAGTLPHAVAAGDFNQDGKLDLAVVTRGSNNVMIRLGAVNDINIQGNNTTISDGDDTPSISDFTDFGSTGLATRTFTIQNTGQGNLTVSNIYITGTNATFFTRSGITLPVVIATAGSATFNVSFSPADTSLKTAIVNISSNDCDEMIYDFALQGRGSGPPTLGTYPATIISTAGGNGVISPSVVPVNASSITATTSPVFKGLLHVNPGTGIITVTNAYPAGTYNVSVNAFNGSIGNSTSFLLTVGNASCSQNLFRVVTNLSVETEPQSIATGDFNGDGKQDLIIPEGSAGMVSIRLGNGAGGFSGNLQVNVGSYPRAVAIGDFNGDGKQDFASANYNSNNVSIRLGDGTGAFSASGTISAGSGPSALAMADFNNDGRQDLAVLNYLNTNVSVLLGNGQGGFTAAGFVAVGAAPQSITVADFNGDGKPDFAVPNYSNNTISVRLGDGAGGFSNAQDVPTGINPQKLVIADFNSDNIQDLAVANYTSADVSVCLGNGTGAFPLVTNTAIGNNPQSLATGDFNGDGKADLVLVNSISNLAYIRVGTGAGAFTGSHQVALTGGPSSITIGDFNNDGLQDFATGNYFANSVSVRLGAVNEINVRGNTLTIPDGDILPWLGDHTDFETVFPGGNIKRTFTIQNTGLATLTINGLSVTGPNASMFAISGLVTPDTIIAGASKTFIVTFTPTSSGLKTASININNNDCSEALYEFTIQGGIVAAALDFDGNNDHIVINNSTGNIGSSDATLSAWVKTTGSGTIISKRNVCGPGNFFQLAIAAGGYLQIEFDDNGTLNQSLTGTTLVNDGAWHHLAAVRQASSIQLYIDGQLDTSAVCSGNANVDNPAPLLIGASACNSVSGFFGGQMDELKFYTRALSDCEILNAMNCEMNLPRAGLLLYYKFNQGRSLDDNTARTLLVDHSTNNTFGVLTNFTLTGIAGNFIDQGPIMAGNVCIDNNTWLGATASWDLPSNWSKGVVPDRCTKVVINAGVPNMPQITSPASTCFSLKLNNGATVTVKGSGKLNVTGKN